MTRIHGRHLNAKSAQISSTPSRSSIFSHSIMLLLFIFNLAISSLAIADYKVYLENRLGNNKNITDFYASLITSQGIDIMASKPSIAMDPFEDNLLLADKVNSPTMTLVDRSLSFTYSCTSGSFDCWPSTSLPLSIPLSPLYCDLLGNYSIDTADKTFGSGQNAVIYKTRYIKFTLNSDFTVSYSIVRKSTDGFIAYERFNLSMEIGRSRCAWAL